MTIKDIFNCDTIIQAGLQAIPYVGGSISTLIYNSKLEKRLKRLEEFYKDVANTIKSIDEKPAPASAHDANSLSSILEKLNDQIEKEHLERKRTLYKIYFIKTLYHPVTVENYDIRMLFLDILEHLTETHIDIFTFLVNQNNPVIDKSISAEGVSPALVQGSISQLKIHGLVDSRLHGVTISANSEISELIWVSQLGREFHDFCMA